MVQKAIWWEDLRMLFIADFHIGKSSHFRKAGIPVPTQVAHSNMKRFIELLQWYQPKDVVFLGDLFHSQANREWQYFTDLLHQFPQVHFHLIKGNHDVLPEKLWQQAPIRMQTTWQVGPFLLTHEPMESVDLLNLCGHVHPGVVLRGQARQGIKLPCYYFDKKHLILPAFGQFTGLHAMKPQKGHRVFAVTQESVLPFGE